MEEIIGLIDKYGVSLALLVWMLYRDHRFLRKLEAYLDKALGAEAKGA